MRETVVKLISMEGFEFVIDREAAMVSQTIRSMLTSPGGFSESKDGVVTFPDISTRILEKICQYLYWSLQYSRSINLSLEQGVVASPRLIQHFQNLITTAASI